MRKSIMILLFLLLLTGCRQGSTPSPAAPTSTASTVIQPFFTRTPSPAFTPTPTACKLSNGTVTQIEIPTKKLKAPIIAKIYLPPCYEPKSNERYPVLYMLHGQASGVDQWVRLGLTDKADQMITAGTIQPMIIVMPFEANWRTVPPESTFGDALIGEVLPFVEGHYAACRTRECRAVGGLSRGGNWAVYLGFAHPELFAAVGAHSAPLFFGEMRRISANLVQINPPLVPPVLFIDIGSNDADKQKVLDFVDQLKDLGVSYEYFQFMGRHEESYWAAHISDYLAWYSRQTDMSEVSPQDAPGK